MNMKSIRSLLLLPLLVIPSFVKANVTEQDFVAKTTQNLLNLCTASPQDENYQRAIHFCQGYLVGAFHFYTAQASNKPELQMVCFPEPKPSRNQAIEMFIAWAESHPQYMGEMPVETEFRFLTETWPCNK